MIAFRLDSASAITSAAVTILLDARADRADRAYVTRIAFGSQAVLDELHAQHAQNRHAAGTCR